MTGETTQIHCKYPGCEQTDLTEYGLCSNHTVDYSRKGEFNLSKIQKRCLELSKIAPKPDEGKKLVDLAYDVLVRPQSTPKQSPQERLL